MEDLISQLRMHARGFWTYRWQAVGASWLLALCAWAAVRALPDHYQASARVYVDTQSILKPLLAGMTSVPNVEQQVSIMSRTLLSRPNLERVMRMVDLDVESTSPRQHERMLNELMSRIQISGTNAHDIYTISYHGHAPRLARDVVQSLLTIFVEGSFHGRGSDSRHAVRFIDEQIRSYEERLVQAENAVKEFKLRNNSALPRAGDYSAQLAQAADALAAARLELAEAEQARNALRAQVTGEPVAGPRAKRRLRVSHPEIDARIATVAKELDALRLQYTEVHPDIIAARRLIGQLEQRKLEEARNPVRDGDPGRHASPMLQQLKVSLADAEARLAAIRVRAAEYAVRHDHLLAQSKAAPEIESQLARLNRDYDVNKDNYQKLVGRREAAKLSGELSSSTDMMTFKIIDPPALPASASGPDRPLLYTAGLLAGLLAGPMTALLIGQARPTFAGPAELRALTGLPVLGTVSMHWGATELERRRHEQCKFAVAYAALVLAWAAVLAATLLGN